MNGRVGGPRPRKRWAVRGRAVGAGFVRRNTSFGEEVSNLNPATIGDEAKPVPMGVRPRLTGRMRDNGRSRHQGYVNRLLAGLLASEEADGALGVR